MDLAQSVRQLQGMQLEGAGYRSHLNQMDHSPLNQVDMRRLQNSILGRSSSTMDLGQRSSSVMDLQPNRMDMQQGNANPFQVSGSAMLVGTVAALQEESGQLRSQWKSDVTRLENELHQLRTAAAYALPQLAEARQQPLIRTEPQLQALVLAGLGGAGSLQQTFASGHTSSALERACNSPLVQMAGLPGFPLEAGGMGDREQLLDRIAVLEGQRKNMELQRDQAMMSQMRCGSAGSDCSGAIFERQESSSHLRMAGMDATNGSNAGPTIMTDRSHLHIAGMDATNGSNAGRLPHERSSMQLTEALLCQMRTQGAVEKNFEDLMGTQDLGPKRPAAADMTSAEVYKELERMEIELQKVRDENGRLKDEKTACEEAHTRDVSTLEAMLSQIMNDNERLTKALEQAELRLRAQNKVPPTACSPEGSEGSECCNQSIRSIRSVMEPAIEPDIDRSMDFDKRRYDGVLLRQPALV